MMAASHFGEAPFHRERAQRESSGLLLLLNLWPGEAASPRPPCSLGVLLLPLPKGLAELVTCSSTPFELQLQCAFTQSHRWGEVCSYLHASYQTQVSVHGNVARMSSAAQCRNPCVLTDQPLGTGHLYQTNLTQTLGVPFAGKRGKKTRRAWCAAAASSIPRPRARCAGWSVSWGASGAQSLA